jgi:hypothetical protein
MAWRPGFWFAGCTMAVATLVSVAWGADSFQAEPGYGLGFNGTDLTGWRAGKAALDGKTATDDATWQVVDGVLVADGAKAGEISLAKAPEKDYNLRLEFRSGPGADNGLLIRGRRVPIRDFAALGPKPTAKYLKPAGEWNELDVTVMNAATVVTSKGQPVTGSQVEVNLKATPPEVKVDGAPVASPFRLYIGPAALVKLNGQTIQEGLALAPRGTLGFRSVKGKTEIRRVRLKEL